MKKLNLLIRLLIERGIVFGVHFSSQVIIEPVFKKSVLKRKTEYYPLFQLSAGCNSSESRTGRCIGPEK